jgi:hypothetical protein
VPPGKTHFFTVFHNDSMNESLILFGQVHVSALRTECKIVCNDDSSVPIGPMTTSLIAIVFVLV